jgi:hypothetical protein
MSKFILTYKDKTPLFKGNRVIAGDLIVEPVFTSGEYGAFILIPFEWTGSTQSNRQLEIYVADSGTYSAAQVVSNIGGLFSTPNNPSMTLTYGVYQDGTNYSSFPLDTLNFEVDLSANFGPEGQVTFLASTYGDNTTGSFSSKFFLTDNTSAWDSTWRTHTTGWCIAFWQLKPNVSVVLNNNVVSGVGASLGTAYLYNGVSNSRFTYANVKQPQSYYKLT